MKRTVALVACGATLVAGGIFAGSVIGGDGGAPVVDRLPGAFPSQQDSDVEVVQDLTPAPGAIASGGGKVKILKGSSSPSTVLAGDIDSIVLRCPNKYSAIAPGFSSDSSGVAAGILAPAFKNNGSLDTRGMFIAVFNNVAADIGWEAWVTCAKGVKDVS